MTTDTHDINQQLRDALEGTCTLRPFIDNKAGKLVFDCSLFSNTELSDVAHHLNCWNAEQPISDLAHNTHYKQYLKPIYDEIDKRRRAFIAKHAEA